MHATTDENLGAHPTGGPGLHPTERTGGAHSQAFSNELGKQPRTREEEKLIEGGGYGEKTFEKRISDHRN